MSTNLIPGRQNLSVTVFVPSKCENNCTFCTSKLDYDAYECNIDKVLKKIRKLSKTGFVKECVDSFVLTGGEPFADLDVLEQILDAIPKEKRVYVNTTFPTNTYSENELALFVNTHRIDGVNISRHCETFEQDTKMFSKNIAKDGIVRMLNVPVKINALLKDGSKVETYLKRWESYNNVSISFRADYREVTRETLRLLSDPILDKMYEIGGAQYLRHGGCDVCFDVVFLYNNHMFFSYHRGLESSSVPFGSNLLVNDVIVFQDGVIAYDWDRTKRLKAKNGLLFKKEENVIIGK